MASWTSNKSVWNVPRGKFDLISAGSGPYLVVVGAVGAEIRLRTKHLVHHIQAAHGEEITENSRESRSAQWCSDRLGTLILPGKDSSGGGEAPRCRSALLRTGLSARTGWNPVHTHPHCQCRHRPPANQRPHIRLCLNELQLQKRPHNKHKWAVIDDDRQWFKIRVHLKLLDSPLILGPEAKTALLWAPLSFWLSLATEFRMWKKRHRIKEGFTERSFQDSRNNLF